MDRWEQLAAALDDLDAMAAHVSGDTAIHFYPPLAHGDFVDLLDDVEHAGWSVEHTGENSATVTHGGEGVRVRFVDDEDMLRVQLLRAPNAADAWAWVDSVLGHAGAHVSGAASEPTPSTTDATAQVGFLEHAYNAASDVAEKAKDADVRVREKLAHAAGRVMQRTADLAIDVGKALPAGQLADRAWKVADDAKAAAKKLLPWYLAIGVGAWIAIGVGAYVVFFSEGAQKRKAEAQRAGMALAKVA